MALNNFQHPANTTAEAACCNVHFAQPVSLYPFIPLSFAREGILLVSYAFVQVLQSHLGERRRDKPVPSVLSRA